MKSQTQTQQVFRQVKDIPANVKFPRFSDYFAPLPKTDVKIDWSSLHSEGKVAA